MHKNDLYKDEDEVRAIISFESICNRYLDRVYTSEIPFYSDQLFDEEIRSDNAGKTNIMKDLPKGIPVGLNLQSLLKKIVISPKVNDYFYKPFEDLIKCYGINPDIISLSEI